MSVWGIISRSDRGTNLSLSITAQLPVHFDVGICVHVDEHVGDFSNVSLLLRFLKIYLMLTASQDKLLWTSQWRPCWTCLGLLDNVARILVSVRLSSRDGLNLSNIRRSGMQLLSFGSR